MDPARVACVELPALPLQLALRARPEWRARPVVVVDRPGPCGQVLFVNDVGRRLRIPIGARLPAASAIAPGLQVAPLIPAALAEAREELLTTLQRCSPRVEPCAVEPGRLWLDPRGLTRLFGELESWGRAVLEAVGALELSGALVIGACRHATLALAHVLAAQRPGSMMLLEEPGEERARLEALPLDALVPALMPAALWEALAPLGLSRVGDLLRLPATELRRRFGREAAELHARLGGAASWQPLQPASPRAVPRVELLIDPPDDNRERLLFMIKGGLARLLAELASSGEALAALTLRLELDLPRADREGREDEALQIEPAAPSRDLLALVDLVRLRLDELELPAPAQSLTLEATPAAPSRAQVDMHLEAGAPRRDPAAAAAALARLRAAYGDQAVTRARVRAAHLPEASFQWEPAAAPPRPQGIAWPRASWAANHGAAGHDGPPLLRRLLRRPLPLDPPPITDMEDFINMSEKTLREPWALPAEPGPGGAIRRLFGPHRVSGGWWARTVERDYYYAETSTGALLWIFHDRARGRWFWHGTVD